MAATSDQRILMAYFGSLPAGGAAARYLHGLARLLRERRVVDVMAPRRRGQRYTERNGPGRVYRVPLGEGPIAAGEGRYLRALQRQLRAETYDAAITADPLTAAALHHSGLEDLRIVYVLREVRADVCLDYLGRLREALEFAAAVVVPDEGVKANLLELGVAGERLFVLDLVPEVRGSLREPPPLNTERLIVPAMERADVLLDQLAEVLPLPGVHEVLLIGERSQAKALAELELELADRMPLKVRTVGSPRGLAQYLRPGGIVLLGESLEAYGALALPHDVLPFCLCSGLPVIQMAQRTPVPDRYAGAVRGVESLAEFKEFVAQAQRDEDVWPALAYRAMSWRQTLSRPNRIASRWLRLLGMDVDAGAPETGDLISGLSEAGSGSGTLTDWAETDSVLVMPTGEEGSSTGVLSEESQS